MERSLACIIKTSANCFRMYVYESNLVALFTYIVRLRPLVRIAVNPLVGKVALGAYKNLLSL